MPWSTCAIKATLRIEGGPDTGLTFYRRPGGCEFGLDTLLTVLASTTCRLATPRAREQEESGECDQIEEVFVEELHLALWHHHGAIGHQLGDEVGVVADHDDGPFVYRERIE